VFQIVLPVAAEHGTGASPPSPAAEAGTEAVA